MKAADDAGSTVILANDPDADRLALAEKQPKYEVWSRPCIPVFPYRGIP